MSDTGNATSLIGCMQEVPDPRAPYNQRHKFLDIIMNAVAAMLCGTLGDREQSALGAGYRIPRRREQDACRKRAVSRG